MASHGSSVETDRLGNIKLYGNFQFHFVAHSNLVKLTALVGSIPRN